MSIPVTDALTIALRKIGNGIKIWTGTEKRETLLDGRPNLLELCLPLWIWCGAPQKKLTLIFLARFLFGKTDEL